ncbi:hypothetical protein D7S70_02490 [Ralstonia pickettii]|nr:hypothetical protein [Ralstonia pickettii]MBB0033734.1 hypothetical protein [Ralstonia pickettii]MBB0096406.1 hypothetical protein [Ralstonia pickettii]MBB0106202.1 hypothetical protein [Ralstonia pickettii]MBB0126704.1 hypothetical protein [Ralstonia pickettii]
MTRNARPRHTPLLRRRQRAEGALISAPPQHRPVSTGQRKSPRAGGRAGLTSSAFDDERWSGVLCERAMRRNSQSGAIIKSARPPPYPNNEGGPRRFPISP